ncbi:hypothetical protein [Clostridium sp. DJ247]|uniref:hypothetical protein n=1 Tax=Clostridium sp. DJ247 TaxID=2726188 RepID=UPI0016261DB5|nr:hypothetical protein [Clostridium sp. DJ247]MBC2580105.1 hypothetical protein [Clostridium sp. DJ247]
MKKVASVVAVALITCSLSACDNRNTSLRNQVTNPGRTNLRIDQRNNVGVNTNGYKDGVYIGQGNNSARGNEAAIVTITNGRISNVFLKSIDNQGREMYASTVDSTLNRTTDGTLNRTTDGTLNRTTDGTLNRTTDGTNNIWRNNITGNVDGVAPGRITTPNGTAPGRTTTPGGTTPGGNIDDMSGNPTGRITNDINRNTIGAPTIDNRNINNNAINNATNNTGRTAATAYDRARQDLAAAIIQNQTHNVNISGHTTETSTINNWKLAVSRALESSKR